MKSSTSTTNGDAEQNGHAKQNGHAAKNGGAEHGVDGLIQKAETLKASLRQTLTAANDLIAALKAHKKQNKAVESALSSLRQLQTVDS
jgi:hypothetical protein